MMKAPTNQIPGVYRRRIGDIWVTAVSDGDMIPTRRLVANLSAEEVKSLLAAEFQTTLTLSVNAFLIHSGDRVALLETGSGHFYGPSLGHVAANVVAAGIKPDEIDTILLTHMHPDHSAGLTDPATGLPLYKNAELVVHENEPRFWFDDAAMARADELYKEIVFQRTRVQAQPYLKGMRTFTSGEVFPGVTALPSFGHTPGHTCFWIESRGERLLILGDTIHVPEIHFARPDMHLQSDNDPKEAIAARLRILDLAVAERVLVAGMHTRFPGFGYVAPHGSVYRFVPEVWRING